MAMEMAVSQGIAHLVERRSIFRLSVARTGAGDEAKGLVVAVEGLFSAVSVCSHASFG